MRPALGGIVVLSVLLLAGCAAPSDEPGDRDPNPSALPGALPPGCNSTLLAVAHLPGGKDAPPTASVPMACNVRTGFLSQGEPTIGFSDNTLWMSTAYEEGDGDLAPAGAPRSQDEGATWQLIRPDAGGQTPHRSALDPYLFVDNTTGRVFFDNLVSPNCSLLSWTDDQGATWDHSLAGCIETDHQTIFAGKPVTSSTLGYPNLVYRCATNLLITSDASSATTCQRSLDGGRSWLAPGEPAFVTDPQMEGAKATPGYCTGAVGHGVTDAQGRVYLPKALCGQQPWLAWSDDEGLTWQRVQVATNGIQGDARGRYSHDAAIAVDTAGNLYVGWVAKDWLPYLAVSQDRAKTWSEPVMLGPPGLTDATMIALDAGSPGRIAWAYVGTRNGPGGQTVCDDAATCWQRTAESQLNDRLNDADPPNITWHGHLGMSSTILASEPILFTSVISNDGIIFGECGPTDCQDLLDFIDVVIGPDGTPWAPFVDDCLDPCKEPAPGGKAEAIVGRLWGGPNLRE